MMCSNIVAFRKFSVIHSLEFSVNSTNNLVPAEWCDTGYSLPYPYLPEAHYQPENPELLLVRLVDVLRIGLHHCYDPEIRYFENVDFDLGA